MSNLNTIQRLSGATSTADLRSLGNTAGRLKRSELSDLNLTQRRTGASSPADLRRLTNR